MTYASAEASVQDSEPRELFVISVNGGVTVYRHTSATRDITYGGNYFTTIALDRSDIAVMTPSEDRNDLTITLPIDHPLVRRYVAQGLPPKSVSVTVMRMQGADVETIWLGDVTSMAADRGLARFRVPSRPGAWMLRAVPSATITRLCPHILYSTMCGVDREGSHDGLAFKVEATVIYVNGRDVRVDLDSTDRNGTWAIGGEVYHPATGERMTVVDQEDLNPGISSVANLTMQFQIVGLKVGDTVHVFAGCDHSITGTGGCSTKFGNRQNYGGMPHLQDIDLFVPGTYGARRLT